MTTTLRILTLGLALATCNPAYAAPEEIQVFIDDIQDAGKISYQLHGSYVTSGPDQPSHDGGRISLHTLRLMPEIAFGLGHGLETAVHFPLAHSPGQSLQTDGFKLRVKYRPMSMAETGWYWATNLEWAAVSRRLAADTRSLEWKNIIGWRNDRALASLNINLLRSLNGSRETGLSTGLKLGFDIAPGVMLGIERYDDLGKPSQIRSQEKTTYVTADIEHQGWTWNFGLGFGRGEGADARVIKWLVGFPLE